MFVSTFHLFSVAAFTLFTLAASAATDDNETTTNVIIGYTGLWQYSYFPSTTCTNCTVRIIPDSDDIVLNVYMILHGNVTFSNMTCDYLNFYYECNNGTNNTLIGSLSTLKEKYIAIGVLEPIFTADSCKIRVENFYPKGMHAVFDRTVEFFIRFHKKSVTCDNPLVQVQLSPFNFTISPVSNSSSRLDCYTSLYLADAEVSSISIYKWTTGSPETVVPLIPGFDGIYSNGPDGHRHNELCYIAINMSNDDAYLLENLIITTPRINLINPENGTANFTIYKNISGDLYQLELVNEKSSGFFMGTHPNYAELELLSKTGQSVNVNFKIMSNLSNNSILILTVGANGETSFSYTGGEHSQEITAHGKQVNLKFSPHNSSSSFVMAHYSVSNGEQQRYNCKVAMLTVISGYFLLRIVRYLID